MKIFASVAIAAAVFVCDARTNVAAANDRPAPEASAVLRPYEWLVGDWKCQLDASTWGALLIHKDAEGSAIDIAWDYGENGKGREVVAYDASRHVVTLDGRESMGAFTRTWNLIREAQPGDEGDVTFEGRASEEQTDMAPHAYRVREEFIGTDEGVLSEWRSAAGEHRDDWHAVGSRHCSKHAAPDGIEY